MKEERNKVAQGTEVLPVERIEQLIWLIRGEKVLLDADLASLYGVETKVLLQTVKRNINRFPDDFMFQLTRKEVTSLRSQIVTSNGRGGRRYQPYAFTDVTIDVNEAAANEGD